MTTCTAPLEQTRQPAVQLLDDAGLAGVGRRPVRLGLEAVGQLHAVRGMLDGAEDLGGMQQRLGRDAAPVQAGATDLLLLHQRDRQARRGRVQRRGVPAGTAAEHHDVEVGHVRCPSEGVAGQRTLLGPPPGREMKRTTARVKPGRPPDGELAGCGMTAASSSGGLVGVGVFFALTRATGWSR